MKRKQLLGLLFIAAVFVLVIGYNQGWSSYGMSFAAAIGVLLITVAAIMTPLINFVERRYGKALAIIVALITVPLVARVLYVTVFGWAWDKLYP